MKRKYTEREPFKTEFIVCIPELNENSKSSKKKIKGSV